MKSTTSIPYPLAYHVFPFYKTPFPIYLTISRKVCKDCLVAVYELSIAENLDNFVDILYHEDIKATFRKCYPCYLPTKEERVLHPWDGQYISLLRERI